MEILIYALFWLAAALIFALSLRAELAQEGRLPRRTSASKAASSLNPGSRIRQ
jgi:hypothetical protein